MALLSVSELTTYRWSFEEDVAQIKRAGYGALGVWRQKLAEFGEERGIELLAESGLRVSNLMWCGGFTGSDGRTFREGLDDALEAVDLAGQLNARCLIVYTGARAGHTHNHARRMIRDALKELLPAAKAQGVVLAVEPMHPDASAGRTFLSNIDEALDLVAAFDDSHLKIAYDTYHLGLSADWRRGLAAAAPHIAVVHLGDGRPPVDREQVRTRLGDGVIPLREMLGELKEAGFDGYHEVELMGIGLEPADYPDLLAHCRDTFAALSA